MERTIGINTYKGTEEINEAQFIQKWIDATVDFAWLFSYSPEFTELQKTVEAKAKAKFKAILDKQDAALEKHLND